jgi:hypothetical protein
MGFMGLAREKMIVVAMIILIFHPTETRFKITSTGMLVDGVGNSST